MGKLLIFSNNIHTGPAGVFFVRVHGQPFNQVE